MLPVLFRTKGSKKLSRKTEQHTLHDTANIHGLPEEIMIRGGGGGWGVCRMHSEDDEKTKPPGDSQLQRNHEEYP